MDPADQFAMEGFYPANHFAMDGLNMAFAAEFITDGKPLPKGLFLDIMTEKTQMMVDHIKHLQVYLVDQRSSFSLNRTKFSLDHKLSPGLYQGFIRCNGKC